VNQVMEVIQVDVPVDVAYNQWTQFEEFPRFMEGVEEVRQLDDTHLHWVASIAGVRREWDAEIVEQVPDQCVSWVNVDGATNRGTVRFDPVAPMSTRVTLALDFEPEGIIENVGDKLGFVKSRARGDLERFREFITSRGIETGGWRGKVRDGMEDKSMGQGTGAGFGTPGTGGGLGMGGGTAGSPTVWDDDDRYI
jgi:uncharacterized membrane protein